MKPRAPLQEFRWVQRCLAQFLSRSYQQMGAKVLCKQVQTDLGKKSPKYLDSRFKIPGEVVGSQGRDSRYKVILNLQSQPSIFLTFANVCECICLYLFIHTSGTTPSNTTKKTNRGTRHGWRTRDLPRRLATTSSAAWAPSSEWSTGRLRQQGCPTTTMTGRAVLLMAEAKVVPRSHTQKWFLLGVLCN